MGDAGRAYCCKSFASGNVELYMYHKPTEILFKLLTVHSARADKGSIWRCHSR